MTPVARISWHEYTKVDIIPDLQVSPVGFQNCFLFWVTWMILEACGVEFERAHSFAIVPSGKNAESISTGFYHNFSSFFDSRSLFAPAMGAIFLLKISNRPGLHSRSFLCPHPARACGGPAFGN